MNCDSTRLPQRKQSVSEVTLGSGRRGSAPLELLMFMPMYVILLAIFLTIASYSRERTSVTTAVRHQAWMRRGDVGKRTEKLQLNGMETTLAPILSGLQDAAGGLVQEHRTGRSASQLLSFIPASQIQMEHAIVTDPWDHRVLKFPEQRQHPALSLDPRCAVFGTVSSGQMSSLLGVSTAFNGLAGELQAQIQQSRQQALREINSNEQRLNQILQDADRERDDLIAQLHAAEQEAVPNRVLIDDLRRRIQGKQESIDRLQTQLSQLREARGYVQRQA